MASVMPFFILYTLQQAGRKNANVIVSDLNFLHALATTHVRRMNVYCFHHIIQNGGRQLIDIPLCPASTSAIIRCQSGRLKFAPE